MADPSEGEAKPPSVDGYSIRVVSRLTGLSADTLRMWERRYGFPKPRRKPHGVRVYGDDHLSRLLVITQALNLGYRPGEAIRTEPEELERLLSASARARVAGKRSEVPSVSEAISRLAADDVDGVKALLSQAAALLGAQAFVSDFAAPLSQRLGDAWASQRLQVRHEHLMTDLLATQLRILRTAYENSSRGPRLVLCTLPGELHSLGLDMVALYTAVVGITPRNLGTALPPVEILRATSSLGAAAVGLSLSSSSRPDQAIAPIHWLLKELPRTTLLWLGGASAPLLQLDDSRVRIVSEWDRVARAASELLAA